MTKDDYGDLKRFVERYEVKEFNIVERPMVEMYGFGSGYSHQHYAMETQRVEMVKMEIPLRSVQRLIDLTEKFTLPRHCHPAIKEAYEQYLFIRAMIDDGHPIQY